MEFLEFFTRVFIAISGFLIYVLLGLFIIIAPFVYIGKIPGEILGIFDTIFFVSLTITIGEYLL